MVGPIQRGDVWWVALPVPRGSEAGFRRPMVVVQGDAFNDTGIKTVVAVPLTSSLALAGHPWVLELEAAATGVPKPSVALPIQVQAVERSFFQARAGRLSPTALERLLAALDVVLGR